MARINSHDPERQEIIGRRAFLFGAGTTLAFATITGRLYQLQVLHHDKYVQLAQDNQFNKARYSIASAMSSPRTARISASCSCPNRRATSKRRCGSSGRSSRFPTKKRRG
jgi:hypothetical protein